MKIVHHTFYKEIKRITPSKLGIYPIVFMMLVLKSFKSGKYTKHIACYKEVIGV